MEECVSPIYNVINTIVNHSEKLFKIIKDLQLTIMVSNSEKGDYATTNATVQDVKDMYFYI